MKTSGDGEFLGVVRLDDHADMSPCDKLCNYTNIQLCHKVPFFSPSLSISFFTTLANATALLHSRTYEECFGNHYYNRGIAF